MDAEDSTIKTDNQDDIEEASRKRTPKSFKPTKIIGFPQRKIEVVFYGEDNRPSGYMQIKKKRSEHLLTKIMPRGKKNENKKTIASVGKYPVVTQVYTYNNNDMYINIQKGVDRIGLDMEEYLSLFLQQIQFIMEDKDLREKLIIASLALQLKKYQRPFFKIPIEKIKEFNLEDIIKEFEIQSKEKEKVWK